ncbi:hypothetical protein JOC74_002629 [Bacillus capparidis]|uniref:Uncharacterized protein n=1 Tax=Bacillus capparidis TaxID=1840411 RepID=A0ABS4CXM3_9BACI|nr:hypothetical protein [Bacillus capparidis]
MPSYSEAISFVISLISSGITIEIKLDRNSPITLITSFMRLKLYRFYHLIQSQSKYT